jgi:muramoyltetrapeptide carboxypeptidase
MRRIGVVAPGNRLDTSAADKVKAAAANYGGETIEIVFHDQCFLSAGHFAGDDAARAAAFLEIANDPAFDALWFARGGYGAGRLLPRIMAGLTDAARDKAYLGYSDAGFILAALMGQGFRHLAHGPMVSDINREGGEAAIVRALGWLVERNKSALEPNVAAGERAVAFNLTVLSHLIGTPWQPDLAGRVLMIEDIDEHMYRIDRSLWQVLSAPGMDKLSGLRLGRISQVPVNDPNFVLTAEETITVRCKDAGVTYLGRAEIGHDAENKVVPFGG